MRDKELVKPTIHMNGTGPKMLLEGYTDAMTAVQGAIEALGQIEFNGRDYYPQGPEAFSQAREEHVSRANRLREIHEELMEMALYVQQFLK